MLRFRHLEIFHAIMETGSVSAAGAKLGLSQPSVTKTLQTLEHELGYALFDRIRGRLQPTEEARALMREVERAHAALEDVRYLSRRLRLGQDTQIRVAATPALGHELLPDAIARYLSMHPRAVFDVSSHHSGDIVSAMGRPSFGFDVGFTFGIEESETRIGSVPIGTVGLACVAKSGVLPAGLRPLEIQDLAGMSVIGLEQSEPLGRLLAGLSSTAGLSLDASIRVQTYAIACALAERGLGIAIVDALTAESYAARFPNVEVRRFGASLSLPVTAIYPVARGLPVATKRFVEVFADALAARP